MSTDLIAFLRARLDEDEIPARLAPMEDWWGSSQADGPHIARWLPDRVLLEVGAKRCILDRHVRKAGERHAVCAECGGSDWKPGIGHDGLDPYPWVMPWPCPTLRLLALPYAGHPDYREEWRP